MVRGQPDVLHLDFALGLRAGAKQDSGVVWEAGLAQVETAGPRVQVQDHQNARAGAWAEKSEDVLRIVGEGQGGVAGPLQCKGVCVERQKRVVEGSQGVPLRVWLLQGRKREAENHNWGREGGHLQENL